MDDRLTKSSCGNASLTEGMADRPLVTFALFAYNQEKYIREAVEGAFSQTYEPLEIILSDDCSSDRTFEIMQEMAAAYVGPHSVYLRRGEINLGTAQHLSAVAQMARGELLIVAAGDDISLPSRTQAIVNSWLEHDKAVSCIHSCALELNDIGQRRDILLPRASSIILKNELERWMKIDLLPFIAPTCAYSKKVFERFGPFCGGSIIEDGPMALRCLLTGPIIYVPEPLVAIRMSINSSGRCNNILDSSRWNRFIRSQIISYITKVQDLSVSDLPAKPSRRLDRKYRNKIRALSAFIRPNKPTPGLLWKTKFIYIYFFHYAIDAKMKHRLSELVHALGYADSPIYRLTVKIAKSFGRRRDRGIPHRSFSATWVKLWKRIPSVRS
ncbi:glycosyl transferase family 2 [Rhodomicrobium vannielii ATCC 17100]|uniref:Glycosyl transferase family 2 n=1 Tax=Rhodomicrobium vannielii (strain ATCC 17100 / DSM 162 / LMG 4299 / NCIMB 10020 / ATH 3.1.1) TaxID=648757 RepID=E3I877_RHOVT|nr:glycosyltransferase [Rhodomicrobium vannielii]ADP69702.1 glycosyl transferase family 2 [Rhodomicrobium vannielii ATCC 17100]